MIKVLAISHAYVEPFTRVGFIDTKKYKDVDLTVAIPKFMAKRFPEGYQKLIEENYKVKTLGTVFNFHQSVRVYMPSLFLLIIKLKSDIIFVNNEPWSSTAFQVVLFCRIFFPKTKIIVYTCENLIRKYPLPFRLLEKFVLKNVDLVLTLTKNDGEIVLRKKGYNGKIAYLPLSVNTDIFKKQNVTNLKKIIARNAKLTIGYIGRLVKEKGINSLIEAVKNLNLDCHLLLLGNGPEEQNLKNLVEKYGLAHKVSFLGHIPHLELPLYINCLDILVLPSRTTSNWKEQFGRVLIEAMACEVAVVGSFSGEIPVVIGDAGLIFKEGDSEDLTKKILLLAENPTLRNELAKKGREHVISNYSREIVDAQTYNLYQMVKNESSC